MSSWFRAQDFECDHHIVVVIVQYYTSICVCFVVTAMVSWKCSTCYWCLFRSTSYIMFVASVLMRLGVSSHHGHINSKSTHCTIPGFIPNLPFHCSLHPHRPRIVGAIRVIVQDPAVDLPGNGRSPIETIKLWVSHGFPNRNSWVPMGLLQKLWWSSIQLLIPFGLARQVGIAVLEVTDTEPVLKVADASRPALVRDRAIDLRVLTNSI